MGTPARAARTAMASASADFPLPTSPPSTIRSWRRKPAAQHSVERRKAARHRVGRRPPGATASIRATSASSVASWSRRTPSARPGRRPARRGRLGQRLAGLRAAGLARRRHQLAQHLGRGLRARVLELADRRGQRAPKRRRQREAGEPVLERLQPPAVGAFGGRRIPQQVLRDAHREPEREDPLAPRARARSAAARRAARWRQDPSRSRAASGVSVANTMSGRISRMQRWCSSGHSSLPWLLHGRHSRLRSTTLAWAL